LQHAQNNEIVSIAIRNMKLQRNAVWYSTFDVQQYRYRVCLLCTETRSLLSFLLSSLLYRSLI